MSLDLGRIYNDLEFGIGMFFYNMICLGIGAIIPTNINNNNDLE